VKERISTAFKNQMADRADRLPGAAPQARRA